MKTIKIIIPALLILIAFESCSKAHLLGIRGKGDNVTESRNESGFTGIHLSIDANVDYVQDSIYSVVISAQPNILSVLETNVKSGNLDIRFSKHVTKHNPITITVHSPLVRSLVISGSGNIHAKNAITSDDMELQISGSGNISVPSVSAKNLTASISGSGNINVAGGTASNESFDISGSGNIDAVNVTSSSNSSEISGSGDVETNVTQSLDLHISGSGDVKYKGMPSVNAKISGSGKVIHLN